MRPMNEERSECELSITQERSRDELSLIIQDAEKHVTEEERVVLKNFLQALQRRLHKKSSKIGMIDSIFRNGYAISLVSIIIFFMKETIDKQVLPSDQLAWKIVSYPSFAIVGTSYASFLLKFLKDEYMPVYSREEGALYSEQRSIIRRFPKKLYIPFFMLAAMFPSGFSIYTEAKTKSLLDSMLLILPRFPVYLGICLFAAQIIGKLYLKYGLPLRERIFRSMLFKKNKTAILQARLALHKRLQKVLYQGIKNALTAYRIDRHRVTHYKNIFDEMVKIETIQDIRQTEIYLHVPFLISMIQQGKQTSYLSKSLSTVGRLLLVSSTLSYLVGLLFFDEIGTIQFLETNYFSGIETSTGNNVLDIFNYMSNMLSYIPHLIMYPFLFQKTVSFLLNKFSDFFRYFFCSGTNIPVIIQQRYYAFLLSCLLAVTILIFSLPAMTIFDFPHWALQGYNKEFNFDHIQYIKTSAAIAFYSPGVSGFFLYAYPLFLALSNCFKYGVWYLLSKAQLCEIQLEKYFKIVLQLIKACKPDPFLETLLGISNQQLQQLFDRDDFEILLEEAYRQKGVEAVNDEVYQAIRQNVLETRKTDRDEEQGQFEDSNFIEGSSSQSKREEQVLFPYRTDRLSPRETIQLIVKMRERELHSRNSQKEEKTEDTTLLPTSTERNWLSPQWSRSAKCVLY
jgi:hypothetical protein